MDSVDWRAQLPPASRQIQVNEIIRKLSLYHPRDFFLANLYYPRADEDKSVEVHKIAQSLEHKIYADATSEADYLHKISLKISLISGYWRTQLPLDSRQTSVNTILDTLRMRLSVSVPEWLRRRFSLSGPVGLVELRKISERLEERIYSSATSEFDYSGRIFMLKLRMASNVDWGIL